jgi:hypothetical protein
MKNVWLMVLLGLASCAADNAREEARAAAARSVDSWSGAKITDLIGVWGWPNGGIQEATAKESGTALWYEPASRISCAEKYPVVEIYLATCQNRSPNDNRLCKDPYTDANAVARRECEAQRQQTGQSDYSCVIVAKFNEDLTITRIDPPRTCSTDFYERLIDRDRRWTESTPRKQPD